MARSFKSKLRSMSGPLAGGGKKKKKKKKKKGMDEKSGKYLKDPFALPDIESDSPSKTTNIKHNFIGSDSYTVNVYVNNKHCPELVMRLPQGSHEPRFVDGNR
jgi:hypothetical protein